MKLKVYGWTSYRNECPSAPNGTRQTREIVAAFSWAAAHRATGKRDSIGQMRNYGGVTGNAEEVALAVSEPGTVFWCPLHDKYSAKCEWRKATKVTP